MSQVFTNEVLVSDVTGTVSVSNFPATQPVSGSLTVNLGLTDAELRATPVPVSTTPVVATTSTVTNVVSTATNQTLLAANANRKKVVLFFEGSTQYVKLGATASASSYTYKIAANNTSLEITGYTGIIDSLGTAGKAILVTELL